MRNAIDHIVVDVEIQKNVDDLPGKWKDTDKMGVAVAVVYEFLTDRYHVYLEGDVPELRERLLRADRISGYNIWGFDFPVIFGLEVASHRPALQPKTNDILQRIWKAPRYNSMRHLGWKLDAVCRGTLGVGKSAEGVDAPKWYQAGQLGRVISYCLDDVRLERNLTTHVDDCESVRHETGMVLPIPAVVPA